jgi:hypothetical protein
VQHKRGTVLGASSGGLFMGCVRCSLVAVVLQAHRELDSLGSAPPPSWPSCFAMPAAQARLMACKYWRLCLATWEGLLMLAPHTHRCVPMQHSCSSVPIVQVWGRFLVMYNTGASSCARLIAAQYAGGWLVCLSLMGVAASPQLAAPAACEECSHQHPLAVSRCSIISTV